MSFLEAQNVRRSHFGGFIDKIILLSVEVSMKYRESKCESASTCFQQKTKKALIAKGPLALYKYCENFRTFAKFPLQLYYIG